MHGEKRWAVGRKGRLVKERRDEKGEYKTSRGGSEGVKEGGREERGGAAHSAAKEMMSLGWVMLGRACDLPCFASRGTAVSEELGERRAGQASRRKRAGWVSSTSKQNRARESS